MNGTNASMITFDAVTIAQFLMICMDHINATNTIDENQFYEEITKVFQLVNILE